MGKWKNNIFVQAHAYTDEQGQTIFMGMRSGAYDLEVSAPGYNSTSSTVFISGDSIKTISLEQVE